MKTLNKFLATIGLAAASMAAQAGMVNIGGLNVPTGGNFQVASIYENFVTAPGQILEGIGSVTQINGFQISDLCSGCELTYVAHYTVSSITPSDITFSGGVVQFYLGFGAAKNFNPYNGTPSYATEYAAATDGVLFMTLVGHAIDAAGNTLHGTGTNLNSSAAAGSGAGLLDVQTTAGSGIATNNFNTDSIKALFGGPTADFQMGTTFGTAFVPGGFNCPGAVAGCLAGGAQLQGAVIPEPGSIGLVGAALAGLGVMATRRRRNNR